MYANAIDLNQLRLVNPALIYLFQPEGHPEHADALQRSDWRSLRITDYSMAQQYHDLFHALRYVEDTLTVQLRRDRGERMTPDELLVALNDIHRHIAHTIGTFDPEQLLRGEITSAGHYARTQVVHWHYEDLRSLIVFYQLGMLGNVHTPKQLASKFRPEGMPEQDMIDFVKLLQRYQDTNKIQAHRVQSRFQANHPNNSGKIDCLEKVVALYHAGKLSNKDKRILNKVLRIPPAPQDVPAKMRQFAERTLERFYALDDTNASELNLFLADLLVDLIEIHPYANGNKRTARALTIAFALALGKPSFLLRAPGEKENPESLYARAFEGLIYDRQLIAEHIGKCLALAETAPYSNDAKRSLIESRLETFALLKSFEARHPEFNLPAFFIQSQSEVERNAYARGISHDDDEALKGVCLEINQRLRKKLDSLDQAKAARTLKLFKPGEESNTDMARRLLEQLLPDTPITRVLQTNAGTTFLYKFKDAASLNDFVTRCRESDAFEVTTRQIKDAFFASIENVAIDRLELAVASSASTTIQTEDVLRSGSGTPL